MCSTPCNTASTGLYISPVCTNLVLLKQFLGNLHLVLGHGDFVADTEHAEQVEQYVVFVVAKLEQVGGDLLRRDAVHDLAVVSDQLRQHPAAGQPHAALRWCEDQGQPHD